MLGFVVKKLRAFGKMSRDLAYHFIKAGDYLYALNVRHKNAGANQGMANQNFLGNESVFSLGSTIAQNKQIAVTFLLSGSGDVEFKIFRNGGEILDFVFTIATGDYATTVSNAETAIDAELLAESESALYSLSNDNGTVTILFSLNTYDYENWSFSEITNCSIYTTQEAIDLSIVGAGDSAANICIGSFDLFGDLFIFSTPCTNLPEDTDIAAIVSSVGQCLVSTSTNHGLLDGQCVAIQGVTGASGINGQWTVTVVSPTAFTLNGSVYSGTPSGGKVTNYTSGYGNIGVATKDKNTNSWTYTKLLSSRVLNFRTKKQIDCHIEKSQSKTAIYFTDDYNTPRVVYYRGAYVTDGCLSFISTSGEYLYDTLDLGTRLITSGTDVKFSFVSQAQVGGRVESGNWRYYLQFSSEAGSDTEYLSLLNPVNVYSMEYPSNTVTSDFATNLDIVGDAPGTATTKKNIFSITDIPVSLFKYVKLIGIQYSGQALRGYVIRKDLITGETMTIEHTGYETETTELNVAEVNKILLYPKTSLNIAAVDNRLILSNVTTELEDDLSDWAQSITHELSYKTLDDPDDYDLAYANPLNVNGAASYMLYDMYRFYVRARRKDSKTWTQPHWVDDVRFDTSNTSPSLRRTAGLPDYNLATYVTTGTSTACYPKVAQIEFSNIQWDFPFTDGTVFSDKYDAVEFMRCERIPEVLATGMFIKAMTGQEASAGGRYTGIYPGSPPETRYAPLFSAFGQELVNHLTQVSDPNQVPLITDFPTGAGSSDGDVSEDIGLFYSPDTALSTVVITYQSGDQLINLGGGSILLVNTNAVGDKFYSHIGRIYHDSDAALSLVEIEDAATVESGSSVTVNAKKFFNYNTVYDYTNTPNYDVILSYERGVALELNGAVTHGGTNRNYGVELAMYYRAIGTHSSDPSVSKYGSIYTSKAVTTGKTIYFDGTGTSNAVVVNGGDVFTQESVFKMRVPARVGGAAGWPSGDDQNTFGTNQSIMFVSQNIANVQMRYNLSDTDQTWIAEKGDLSDSSFTRGVRNDLSYDKSYNIQNGVQNFLPFNPNLEQVTDLPTRIYYSALKQQDSLIDDYRLILPLNFKDLDSTYGEIKHHAAINGELFTWQQRKLQRQYFNQRGELSVSDDSKIIVGSGAVMGRDGQTINIMGTSHKWSVIKGISPGGNDTVAWINTELKKVIKFGYDGTKAISEIEGMDSWFSNNLRFVDGEDTPADDLGIHGVFSPADNEFIWTIRGRKQVSEWGYSDAEYIVQHELDATLEGSLPRGDLLYTGGLLYGVAFSGGANAVGTLFSIDPSAAYPASTFTVLYDFDSATGSRPEYIVLGSDGKIYGITTEGGANNYGVLWSWDIGGAIYTDEYDFTASEGVPRTLAVFGNYLIMTSNNGGTNGVGCISLWDVLSPGLSTGYSFDSNNHSVVGSLTYSFSGTVFYGITDGGTGGFTIFSYDIVSQIFTVLNSSLILSPTNGLTQAGSLFYFSADSGGIYSFNPSDLSVVLARAHTDQDIMSVYNKFVYSSGKLYGAAYGYFTYGGIFTYDPTNDILYKYHTGGTSSGSNYISSLVYVGDKWWGTFELSGPINGASGIYSIKFTDPYYSIGDEVQYGSSVYEQTPDIYVSLINDNANNQPGVDTNPQSWLKKEHSDPDYYNEYTIVYSEDDNGFSDFRSHKPKIYLRHREGYLSPDPVSGYENAMYEHNRGDYSVWYNGQSEDGYIELIFAEDENVTKAFKAIMTSCEQEPYRIEVVTKNHETLMISGDYEVIMGQFETAIKNDILTSSDGLTADEDTTSPWGQWAKIRFYFQAGSYQQLNDIALKFIPVGRSYLS
jgi:hypothetical protein